MKCPHCDATMANRTNAYDLYFDDNDGLVEFYVCPRCLVKCKKFWWNEYEWIIPEGIDKPTDSQIRTIAMINHFLSLNLPTATKRQCRLHIDEYLKQAQAVKTEYLKLVMPESKKSEDV